MGIATLAAWVAGCTSAQLASHTVKSVEPQQKPKPSAPPQAGTFKIGKPYEVEGTWYYPQEDYNYSETGIASWYGPDFHGKQTANGEVFDMNELTAAHKTLQLPSLVRVTNLDNGRTLVVRVNDRGPFVRGRIIDLSRRSAQLLGFEQSGTAKVRVEVLGEESRRIAAVAKRMPGADDEPARASPAGTVTVESLPGPGGGPVATAQVTPSQAAPSVAPPTPAAQPVPSTPAPTVASASSASPAAPTAVNGTAVESLPAPTGQIGVVAVKPSGIFVQAGAFSNQSNAQRLSTSLAGIGPTKVVQVKLGSQVFYRVRVGPAANVEDADRMLERVAAAGYPEARIVVD